MLQQSTVKSTTADVDHPWFSVRTIAIWICIWHIQDKLISFTSPAGPHPHQVVECPFRTYAPWLCFGEVDMTHHVLVVKLYLRTKLQLVYRYVTRHRTQHDFWLGFTQGIKMIWKNNFSAPEQPVAGHACTADGSRPILVGILVLWYLQTRLWSFFASKIWCTRKAHQRVATGRATASTKKKVDWNNMREGCAPPRGHRGERRWKTICASGTANGPPLFARRQDACGRIWHCWTTAGSIQPVQRASF